MTGEIMSFRKKFIGGFNRDDVATYITKITKERNDSIKAKEKVERELLVLRGENNREKEKAAEETQGLINEYRIAKEKAENDAELLLIQQNDLQMKINEMQAKINELQNKTEKIDEPTEAYEPVNYKEPDIYSQSDNYSEPDNYDEPFDNDIKAVAEDEIATKIEEFEAFPRPATSRLVIKMNKKV